MELFERGTISWIDLGLAGDRYFGLMAGIGMDAAVVASMSPTLKKAFKEAAFAVQGLATYLTKEEPLIRVTSPEKTVEGYFAVFGNSSNYAGAFGITPLADMRDGLLDVCVLKDKSFLSTVWYWTAALINAHITHPQVEYFRTEHARIETVDPGKEVLVQTDGEVAGALPLDCRVGAACLARRRSLTDQRPSHAATGRAACRCRLLRSLASRVASSCGVATGTMRKAGLSKTRSSSASSGLYGRSVNSLPSR